MKKFYHVFLIVALCLGLFFTFLGSYTWEFILFKIAMYGLFTITLYYGLLIDQQFFSPFTLFGTYPFCCLLYSDYISTRYLPLLDNRGMVILFVAGISAFYGMQMMRGINASRYSIQTSQYEVRYSTMVPLFFFIVPMIIMFMNMGPMDFSSIEGVTQMRDSSSIVILSSLSAFYAMAIINAVKCNQRWAILAIFVFLVISFVFKMSKGTILNAILAFLFALEIYHKDILHKIKLKKLILLVSLLLVIIVVIFQICGELRSGKLGTGEQHLSSYEYARYYNDINYIPQSLQRFYSIYMYMVTPSSNVSYLVENHFIEGNGTLSCWPILSTFQLKRLWNLELPQIPIRTVPYNTFSFGGSFYYDGGWLLVVIGCFLLGLLTYYFYLRHLANRDVIVSAEYFFWGLALFYTFFSNHFITQCYPLRILIVFECYRLFCSFMKAQSRIQTTKPGNQYNQNLIN